MQPQSKDRLMRFTLAAKAIIFNAARFKQLLKLMNTKPGAIQAVQSVMGGIEQKQKVPPDIAILLAVNIYLLMVDMAQDVTGMKADKTIVQGVVMALMQTTLQSHKPQQSEPQPVQQAAPQPAPQAAPPAGLINQGA